MARLSDIKKKKTTFMRMGNDTVPRSLVSALIRLSTKDIKLDVKPEEPTKIRMKKDES